MTIIDEQRRAALLGQPARDLCQCRGGAGTSLDQRSWGLVAPARRHRGIHRLRSGGEDEALRRILSRQRHHPLAPARFGPHQLAHRQRIEKFIGDQQQRAIFGQAGDIVVEYGARKRFGLDCAQRG